MGRRVLLVEGPDDEHVLKHICGTRGLPILDEVIPLGGADPLLEHLPVRLKASEGEDDIVGLVIDADTHLDGRWHSISQRVQDVGYVGVPENPHVGGTIIDPPRNTLLPRLGVWLMPDNQTNGILEDFLRFLVPQPNLVFDHAVDSIESIPAGLRMFRDCDKPKVLIHTWLAWQENPGRPYGTAITARFLCPDVPEVDILVSWLRRLFSP